MGKENRSIFSLLSFYVQSTGVGLHNSGSRIGGRSGGASVVSGIQRWRS